MYIGCVCPVLAGIYLLSYVCDSTYLLIFGTLSSSSVIGLYVCLSLRSVDHLHSGVIIDPSQARIVILLTSVCAEVTCLTFLVTFDLTQLFLHLPVELNSIVLTFLLHFFVDLPNHVFGLHMR